MQFYKYCFNSKKNQLTNTFANTLENWFLDGHNKFVYIAVNLISTFLINIPCKIPFGNDYKKLHLRKCSCNSMVQTKG